jgi:hypothetical protein
MGRPLVVRSLALVVALWPVLAQAAPADRRDEPEASRGASGEPVASQMPAEKDKLDPEAPRWKLRMTLASGFGGSRAGDNLVAVFPTTLELGVRIFGPLSLDVALHGMLTNDLYVACGETIRPHAIYGTAGVRVDFINKLAGSWVDPYVAVHFGVAGQPGGREIDGRCGPGRASPTGGVRLGLDVWLGRAAVNAAVGFDVLAIASPIAFFLGASFVLK